MPAIDLTQDLLGLLNQIHEAHQEFWGGPPCSDSQLIERALVTELARITDLNRLVQAQRDYAYIGFLEEQIAQRKEAPSRSPRVGGPDADDLF